MKFLALSALLTLAAIPFVKADGASILAAEQNIDEVAVAFNETIAGFNGNPLTIVKILAQSTELLNVINTGTFIAKSSANLTDTEALNLVGETTTLVADVQSTLNTLISKKNVFVLTLTEPTALLNLKLEKAASDAFGAAVVSKVPVALQPVAASLIAPLDPAFDAAIAAFSTL